MPSNLSRFTPVADGVHVAIAQPDAVNITLIVGESGALLVDTGSSPTQGRAIREAAQAVAGAVPLTHVVVTHAHTDHLLGLSAFADLETLGHARLAELVAQGGMPERAVAPQRTFELATTVDLGACYVEVVHFGRGHTDHDVVVLIPGRGVVVAGDLLESAGAPVLEEDSFPELWPLSLDGLLGTLRKDAVVVPGHGPVMTREDAFMQRAELNWYHGKAIELYDQRRPAQGAWTEDGHWPWAREGSEAYLTEAMRQLEASGRPRARQLPLLRS